MNNHELLIQCSDSRYRCLVGVLASALGLPRQAVEQNLEVIFARIVGRLACSPMTVAALVGRSPGRVFPQPKVKDRDARVPVTKP